MTIRTIFLKSIYIVFCLAVSVSNANAQWLPKPAQLETSFTKDVNPQNAHPQYPRPQMVREKWKCLNGLWDYAIRPTTSLQPEDFDGKILVPFPVESTLSSVAKPVNKSNRLWYKRTFTVDKDWLDQTILLHFDAVDWDTTVWLNGKMLGNHRGGYDPFTFDITEFIIPDEKQQLVVSVWDPSEQGSQPCGKQYTLPETHGCRYTCSTGIWQSVWLEPVPPIHIKNISLTPDIDKQTLKVEVQYSKDIVGYKIEAKATKGISTKAKATALVGEKIFLEIDNPELWSPQNPFLYDLQLTLTDPKGKTIDQVESYFGMRKIALAKDPYGHVRILLNNKPIFLAGPLDQGFWPDGLHTAPTDEALQYDIDAIKKLGFNTTRKHVKVEMQRWYYHCDKMGLLIWQDMPSNPKAPENKTQFEKELVAMIDNLYNHPSVIIWSIFNEGWGEYDSERLAKAAKQKDPTRLVNEVSGGLHNKAGDIEDIHNYPSAGCPKPEPNRVSAMGETGGMGLIIENHMWQQQANWGYSNYKTIDQLTTRYLEFIRSAHILKSIGLSAVIYTQLSDIETEINGLLTYDRKVFKVDPEKFSNAINKLQSPPPVINHIVPSSRTRHIIWSYTTSVPDIKWNKPDFDCSKWPQGPAGFGTENALGSFVGTIWTTDDIWLRRNFQLETLKINEPYLYINQNDNAEVYINGIMVDRLPYSTEDYVLVPLNKDVIDTLKIGNNFIAIHCKQTRKDGQYIDAGIIDVIE